MAFAERLELIRKIQGLRNSKILTYITSDRANIGLTPHGIRTQLSTEAQIFIYNQLLSLGRNDNIDLFIYTRGGETDSVWPLVNIFREFAQKKFAVLVPFRCHSAGTLICLGANEIVMGEAGELSPIDPATGNQFNPIDEITKQRKGISVEDVTSFMELAKDSNKVGLKDSTHILEVFKQLAKEVHPIALGNVNRAHTQIRILVDKLMRLHLDGEKEKDRIEKIVDYLTKNLYSHSHAINRKEAREILGEGLVVEAKDELQASMWQLYEEYDQTLQLRDNFCIDEILMSKRQEQEVNINSGFIETEEKSFIYQSKSCVSFFPLVPQGFQFQVPPGQTLPWISGLPANIDLRTLSAGYKPNPEGV